jgi:hypothetical protein
VTREASALMGAVFSTVGPAAVVAVRWAVTRRPAVAPAGPGVVATGYRYCPAEMRTRAAVLHGDGSAQCADCHAHIPARTEEVPHA